MCQLSILKYNITLEPQYIKDFISNPEEFKYTNAEFKHRQYKLV